MPVDFVTQKPKLMSWHSWRKRNQTSTNSDSSHNSSFSLQPPGLPQNTFNLPKFPEDSNVTDNTKISSYIAADSKHFLHISNFNVESNITPTDGENTKQSCIDSTNPGDIQSGNKTGKVLDKGKERRRMEHIVEIQRKAGKRGILSLFFYSNL